MDSFVIDTNLLVVANEKYPKAEDSEVATCQSFLFDVRKKHVSLDSMGLIFEEYFKHARRSGQPGMGDAFVKWLWDNQQNQSVCEIVTITPGSSGDREFLEFPDIENLKNFDRDDQKFAAVANASRFNTIICNATDSDWWDFKEGFEEAGISINFLCPRLIKSM